MFQESPQIERKVQVKARKLDWHTKAHLIVIHIYKRVVVHSKQLNSQHQKWSPQNKPLETPIRKLIQLGKVCKEWEGLRRHNNFCFYSRVPLSIGHTSKKWP